MSFLKKALLLILISIIIFSSTGCSLSGSGSTKPATYTPQPPTPIPDLKVLFLGERLLFFNYWPQTDYQNFSQAADPSKYTVVEYHFEGGTDVNNITLREIWERQSIQEMIQDDFDVIVIQEAQEVSYEDKDSFYAYTRKFFELAKSEGAELVLFMNWPEKKRWDDLQLIEQSYQEISQELGVKVAPVGLAWQRSIQQYPDLNLFFDDWELSSKYGDYLALCVVYATITGKTPVGVPYYGYLTEEEAAILQQVAWESVQEYQQ